jgi:HupE/UreJ protein
MDRRAALAAVASVLVVVCSAPAASAHSGGTRYVLGTPSAEGVELDVSMDATEVAAAAGLGSSVEADELLGARGEIVTRLLDDGLSVSAGGERCAPTAGALGLVERDGASMVGLPLRFACQSGGALVVADGSLTPGTTSRTFVAVDGPGGRTTQLLAPGSSSATLTAPTAAATAQTFVLEGMRHLVTGYDHLLFVLSLLLGAGLRARARGLRTALRETAMVVTSFTIGHSITLAVAALGLVPFSSRLVEAAIAGSIIAVAALNVLRPDHAEGRPWLALAFGMIHGFGFSSVLAEVGLPRGRHVVALVSFNLGIELAQLAFVTLVLVPLAWLARHRLYRGVVMQAGSAAIAICGAVWLWQRLAA